MKQIFDPIRKKWVISTPEEVIRQKWIEVMINHLGFPKELLVIEKGLKNLAHLKGDLSTFPDRRVDILSYMKSSTEELSPLLLIECKCISLNEKALKQVMGYHHLIRSHYIALANEDEILLGVQKKNQLEIFPFLPDYNQLIKALHLKPVISSDHS